MLIVILLFLRFKRVSGKTTILNPIKISTHYYKLIYEHVCVFVCSALQLEYLDLYLIHWPVSSRPGIYEFPIKKEDLLAMDFKGVWAAMEECQKLGLAKSIGVSNFSCKKLSDLLEIAEIPPAINQVSFDDCVNEFLVLW